MGNEASGSGEAVQGLPLLSFDDAVKAVAMAAGFVAAHVVSRSDDVRMSGWLLACWLRLRPGKRRAVAAAMRAVVPGERDWHNEAKEYLRMIAENGWGRVRAMRAGSAIIPDVTIEGLDHVRRSLADRRGVILWRMAFCSGPALMCAFHREGLPLVHLSRSDHGSTSLSRLGLRTVCRWWQRAENPHLEERVTMPLNRSLGYVRALVDRLRQNRVVSIAGEHAGEQSVEVCLLGRLRSFGQGAPSLAWITGASLLPVYMMREAPYTYRVVIEKPIRLESELGKQAAVRSAVEEFAHRIECRVIERPSDYRGWGNRSVW